ncbi:MAG: amidohydrolase [Pirellulaceae bacterium]
MIRCVFGSAVFALSLFAQITIAIAQYEPLEASIERRADESWAAAHKIWEWAEPGYQETRSSALLAEMLEKAGFKIQRGVAGIPTAFTATIGQGKPVVGILGEYDALPGLSQAGVPVQQPREETSWGHGCGHHLFGVASASAAIAVGEQIKAGEVEGTLRFYGCPAEEGGAAKVFMVRDGLFDDCDVVLHWHPGSKNVVGDRSCLSRIAAKFRFHGKSSHAAGAPEQGRSALDAVELTNHAAQLLREHTPDFTRIHHVVTYGGAAPNVVPDFCEVYYYIRHPDADVVRQLYPRLLKCAQAGALGTETRLEEIFLGGTMPLMPNNALSQVVKKHLTEMNDLEYNEQEQAFAVRLQTTMEKPRPLEEIAEVDDQSGQVGKGSTDVGDVSWVVPTTGFSTACWVPGTPGHSWQATACGGTSIGRQGMNLATRVLAATAWDLFHSPELIAAAKAEHKQRLGKRAYQAILHEGQSPPLDYRNPPRR